MLTLGIPGDTNTLMLMGAMLIHGLIPGPALFREETTLVYVIFLVIILANLWILVLGLRFAPLVARLTQVDKRYIIPVILILSITGPAISEGHLYYFWITIIFGALGFVMDRHGFSVMGMAMGIVLGPIIERNLAGTHVAAVAHRDFPVEADRRVVPGAHDPGCRDRDPARNSGSLMPPTNLPIRARFRANHHDRGSPRSNQGIRHVH